jgi:SAM-dependent methyltransferase
MEFSVGRNAAMEFSNTQQFWDEVWKNPEFQPFWWVDGPQVLIRSTIENGWLATGCSVLEIGCGTGQGAGWLANVGFDVTAIDFSEEAICRARRDFPGVNFRVADVTVPNSIDGRFDAIVDSVCLHALQPHHRANYLQNLISWSHSGSRVMILMPCQDVPPLTRLASVRQFFNKSFLYISHEARAGCLPLSPEIVMMVVRMERLS